MNSLIQCQFLKGICKLICLLLCLLASIQQAEGQEQPPRPISVRTLQGLNFGAFVQSGDNGEVIISPEGSRGVNGSIILTNISSSFYAARFEIDAEPGTLISIEPSMATLSGPENKTLTLELGKCDKGNPFIIPYTNIGEKFYISIGGILKVGPLLANPAGSYSGTFTVTFIQQ